MLLILPACAIIPGIWLLTYIYKHDSLDKEPKPLLKKLLIAGGLSTIIALIGELVFGAFLREIYPYNDILHTFLENFLVVALVEEGCKFICLKLITWNNENFSSSFDGVVYAVYISLGFAIIENIFYVISGGLGTAIVRAFTAMPGHMCFGVIMGRFYAIAKKKELIGDTQRKNNGLKYAILFPVLAHGLYDFSLSIDGGLSVLLFIAVAYGLFKYCFRLVKQLSIKDEYFRQEI